MVVLQCSPKFFDILPFKRWSLTTLMYGLDLVIFPVNRTRQNWWLTRSSETMWPPRCFVLDHLLWGKSDALLWRHSGGLWRTKQAVEASFQPLLTAWQQICERLWTRTTHWTTPKFLTLRNCKMITAFSFQLLSLGVICYAARAI